MDFSLPSPATISDEAFRRVRDFLVLADYSERRIKREFCVETLSELTTADRQFQSSDLLLGLFLLGQSVPAGLLEIALPPGVYAVLIETGLLRVDGDSCYCPVLMYPMNGVYVASDRLRGVNGSEVRLPWDFVYLALTPNSIRYLEMLPARIGGSFLELGCGAGVASLKAASTAKEAVGIDITERSVRFAEWSRRLNAAENVRFLVGDLYSPVEGQPFDCIAAHPPHDPSFRKNGFFADGGDDGEQIFRRIIAGLPVHLKPRGRAYFQVMASDRRNAPFEQRVREWLDAAVGEFDISVVVRQTITEEEIVEQTRARPGEPESYRKMFRDLEIERLVYGSICLERHGRPRRPITVRDELASSNVHEQLTAPLR